MNEANYGKCRDLSVIWEFSKFLRLSINQLVEELEAIRIALVQKKSGGKVEMVV